MVVKMEDYMKDVPVLSLIEGIRKRPGMFIGGNGRNGVALHNFVTELVSNMADYAIVENYDIIKLEMDSGNVITIFNNGHGFPVELHESSGLPIIEDIFTNVRFEEKPFTHYKNREPKERYNMSLVVANALSEWLIVQVCRDGKFYELEFKKGYVTKKVSLIGDAVINGMFIHFMPDCEIFGTEKLNFNILRKHLNKTAFYAKNDIKFEIIDKRTDSPNKCKNCKRRIQNGRYGNKKLYGRGYRGTGRAGRYTKTPRNVYRRQGF